MSVHDKLHRWLDLIAALLRHRYPRSLQELRGDVPGYADPDLKLESLKRAFERDKDELRDLGVTIDTLAADADSEVRYQLRHRDFYLPYLTLGEKLLPPHTDVQAAPRRPSGIGYASLPTVTLTPDECHTLRRAAARVAGLGHPQLAHDATSAMRKLQFDVELFAHDLPAAATLRVDGDVFDVLNDAVTIRKRVTFTYHGLERGETTSRLVHPYGLVFLTGHWYLVAHDPGVGAMRQFRVSRIRDAKLGDRKQTPDFDVPADFDLSAYAASRRAWEIGNGDQELVIVAFRGDTGLVTSGMQLGRAVSVALDEVHVPAGHTLREFPVRRRDVFLRWVLSFAGDARPVHPPVVVADFLAMVRDTHAAATAPVEEVV